MTIQSVNPRTGEKFGAIISETTPIELEAMLALSQAAFVQWSTHSPMIRAKALRSISDALQENIDALVEIADLETGLGRIRLTGEVARTTFQLREFASAIERGEFVSPCVDSAVDAPLPQGHPELVRTFAPIGIVAVFGASNFPFAFSVLGGDTASALAAGCTVIVKSHSAHPHTSLRTYEIASEALANAGAPKGTLLLVHGHDAGKQLLESPEISAGAFTGSRNGGRALFDIANTRNSPIPFYGELGSVNSVVVLNSAISDAQGFATAYLDSLLLGNGQFCTNPSILFIPEDSHLASEIGSQIAFRAPAPFLSEATKFLHDKNREALRLEIDPKIFEGERAGDVGFYSTPMIFLSSVAHASAKEAALAIECFGPTGLVLTYAKIDEVTALLARMEGALVGSLFSSAEDISAPDVIRVLAANVGRVAWNAWPTGVAVSGGQHHGGPYPASTSPLHTSVGLSAIIRFLRPVTFQSLPSALFKQVDVNIERLNN